jgi:hypothetical protein
MIRADIFPLNIRGDICRYCDYRKSCGGVGIAEPEHGKPAGVR